jgi:hypothetical protein
VRGAVPGSVDGPHRDSGRRLFLVTHPRIRYLQKRECQYQMGELT